ncbi:aspartate aminotransferase family protein [Nitratifractor sp.]|uniref:aspartate aminotransferase family protein n=1 Tax=Nitratifractor sp. TaxID=2268144 RepID=UPI0025F9C70E|nr:aspartate aminotransferase family protein [Nitratifractor sp.]
MNDLERLDKEYVLASYARNYTNFVRGEGAKLYDESGREFIDFASGIGVSSLGHAHPKLSAAICDQASKLIHVSNLQVIEPQAKLAQRLVELSGYDMRCFFGNSGAEANEAAIKIARKYGETRFETKRYKVITLKHSFHGRTITTVKATGQKEMHKPDFSPYPAGFAYVDSIDAVYEAIDDETVAVMIELVQGEGGVQPFEREEVRDLAKFLRSRELLLIVDEVQTGVYRTGEFLASQLYGIEPDVVTLAKGLGGGVPIGVAMTRLKEIFKPGDHGSTFGGNYLSTRAGLTVLEVLEEERKGGALQHRIDRFSRYLERLAGGMPERFSEAVGLGLMRGLRCRDAATQGAILEAAFAEGLILLKAGRNTVRFLPPLIIGDDEIDEGFKRFEKALATL